MSDGSGMLILWLISVTMADLQPRVQRHWYDNLGGVVQISWAATAAPLTLLLVSLP